MLTRIRPRLVLNLIRKDLPAPVDVINLISPANFDRYRWYGLLVMPAMMAVGGRLLWMGRFEHSVSGQPQAEKLLIVRYPSHRRFLAMTLNPYYLAINVLREAGVRRFEASFTHASHTDPGLARRRNLVGVHFNSPPGSDALGAITEMFAQAGHELAYATRMTAPLGILEPPRDTDPNPLTFGELALFAAAGDDGSAADGLGALSAPLAELTDSFSLQCYEREPRNNYRPSLRPVPQEVVG